MSKKKTKTIEFNRKIKKATDDAYYKGLAIMKFQLLNLIPLPQQVIDAVRDGVDVTIHCDISAKKLLEILDYGREHL